MNRIFLFCLFLLFSLGNTGWAAVSEQASTEVPDLSAIEVLDLATAQPVLPSENNRKRQNRIIRFIIPSTKKKKSSAAHINQDFCAA